MARRASLSPALFANGCIGVRVKIGVEMTYCEYSIGNPIHGPYHDAEYGFRQTDEDVLFERLILEINQAGLSWETILKKRATFRIAYDGFSVDKVAAYGAVERERLMADPGVIRNRLKVEAAIHN